MAEGIVTHSNVLLRLRRLIGQLHGVEKMLKNERDCVEIVTQIMAARASLEKLGLEILQDESMQCFTGPASKRKLKQLETITKTMFKVA